LYSSSNIVRQNKKNEVGGTCGMHGSGEKLHKILVGKPEGKKPLGRPTRRWKDRFRTDLGVIGWEDAEWVQLDQDRGQW
jgi:hypothetical protein